MRVLAVDDNEDAVRCLGKLLELAGHEVRLAFDGRTAIKAATEFQPEIVLLDIAMPVITGIDVAKAIREIPGLNTLLVAVTGYGDKTTRRRIAEAGFDHMVLKPCQFPELQRILTEAARRSEPEMSQ